MATYHVDIETRSRADLKKVGAEASAEMGDRFAQMEGEIIAVSPLAFSYDGWAGHEHLKPKVGDRVLQHIAVLLQGQARASDFVFRYGGEEFLAVINEVTPTQAMAVADKIRTRIEALKKKL